MSVDQIMNAKSWVDVFPKGDNDARKTYRALLRTVHPDVCHDPRANDAFIKLRRLYANYRNGDASTDATSSGPKFVSLINDDAFLLTRTDARYFWIALNRKDNDLMDHAATVLEDLKKSDAPQFFPDFKSRFRDGTGRAGVEVAYPEGTWNLSDFERFDERTVVWVFKRILVSLILAHSRGHIHGNIDTHAIQLLPTEHGMILDNWGYCVPTGQKLKIRPSAHIPEVYLKGKESEEWVDLSAAGALALKMSNGKMHIRLKRFFTALRDYKENDAAQVLRDFNDVTEDIFGPPKFHPLAQPSVPPLH